MLSPGLSLLPKAAESWADLGTHQEPPPALQGNLPSVVGVPYGFGETAPWSRSPPSCCRSRGIPLSPSFSRNCLGMLGTACSLLAGWEHLPFPRLPRKTPQQRRAKRNPGDSDPAWSSPWETGSRVERDTLEETPATLPALAGDIVLLEECPSDQTSVRAQ